MKKSNKGTLSIILTLALLVSAFSMAVHAEGVNEFEGLQIITPLDLDLEESAALAPAYEILPFGAYNISKTVQAYNPNGGTQVVSETCPTNNNRLSISVDIVANMGKVWVIVHDTNTGTTTGAWLWGGATANWPVTPGKTYYVYMSAEYGATSVTGYSRTYLGV